MQELTKRTDNEQEILNRALIAACRENSIDGIKKAIASGANLNSGVITEKFTDDNTMEVYKTTAAEELFNVIKYRNKADNSSKMQYLNFDFDMLMFLLKNGLELTQIDIDNLQLMFKYFDFNSKALSQENNKNINKEELLLELNRVKQCNKNEKILEYFKENIDNCVAIFNLVKCIDINAKYCDKDDTNKEENTIGDSLFKEACLEQYNVDGSSEIRTRYNVAAINELIEAGVDTTKKINKGLLLNVLNNVFIWEITHESNNCTKEFYDGIKSIYKQSDVNDIINNPKRIKDIIKQLSDYYVKINDEFVKCCAENNNEYIDKMLEIPYVNINHIKTAEIYMVDLSQFATMSDIIKNNDTAKQTTISTAFICLFSNKNKNKIEKFLNLDKFKLDNENVYKVLAEKYNFNKSYDEYKQLNRTKQKEYLIDELKRSFTQCSELETTLNKDIRHKVNMAINVFDKNGKERGERIAKLFKNAIKEKQIWDITYSGSVCKVNFENKYKNIIKNKENITILSQIYKDFTDNELDNNEIDKFIDNLYNIVANSLLYLIENNKYNKLKELLLKYKINVIKFIGELNDGLLPYILDFSTADMLLLLLKYRRNDTPLSKTQKLEIKNFIEEIYKIKLDDSDLLANTAVKNQRQKSKGHTLRVLEETIKNKVRNKFISACGQHELNTIIKLANNNKNILNNTESKNAFDKFLNNINKDFENKIELNGLISKDGDLDDIITIIQNLDIATVNIINSKDSQKIKNILKYDFAIDLLNNNENSAHFADIVCDNKLYDVLAVAIKNGFDYAKNERIKNMLLECLEACNVDKNKLNDKKYIAGFVEQLAVKANNIGNNQNNMVNVVENTIQYSDNKQQGNDQVNNIMINKDKQKQMEMEQESKKKEEQKQKLIQEEKKMKNIEKFKRLCKEHNIEDISDFLFTQGNDFKLYIGLNGQCNKEFKDMCSQFKLNDINPIYFNKTKQVKSVVETIKNIKIKQDTEKSNKIMEKYSKTTKQLNNIAFENKPHFTKIDNFGEELKNATKKLDNCIAELQQQTIQEELFNQTMGKVVLSNLDKYKKVDFSHSVEKLKNNTYKYNKINDRIAIYTQYLSGLIKETNNKDIIKVDDTPLLKMFKDFNIYISYGEYNDNKNIIYYRLLTVNDKIDEFYSNNIGGLENVLKYKYVRDYIKDNLVVDSCKNLQLDCLKFFVEHDIACLTEENINAIKALFSRYNIEYDDNVFLDKNKILKRIKTIEKLPELFKDLCYTGDVREIIYILANNNINITKDNKEHLRELLCAFGVRVKRSELDSNLHIVEKLNLVSFKLNEFYNNSEKTWRFEKLMKYKATIEYINNFGTEYKIDNNFYAPAIKKCVSLFDNKKINRFMKACNDNNTKFIAICAKNNVHNMRAKNLYTFNCVVNSCIKAMSNRYMEISTTK